MEKTDIPASNIMARWTKNATQPNNNGMQKGGADHDKETTEYIRKQLSLKKVLTAAGVDGTIPDGGLTVAMAALDKLTSLRTTDKGVPGANMGEYIGTDEEALTRQCPPRPIRRGRPRNSSLKSYENEKKNQVRSRPDDTGKKVATSTDENPRNGKTRALNELLLPV